MQSLLGLGSYPDKRFVHFALLRPLFASLNGVFQGAESFADAQSGRAGRGAGREARSGKGLTRLKEVVHACKLRCKIE